ncbi:MAG: Crp/Fnr family transcriptional regulator [Candidatus Komeilibacteria bacterium]
MLVSELQKIPFFRSFSKTASKQLASFVKTLTLNENEILFREGSKRDKVYLVNTGAVLIEQNILGQAEPLAVFQPYDVVGETSIYAPGTNHTHTARALYPNTTVIELSLYQLLKVFQDHPAAAQAAQLYFIRMLNERLSRTNHKLLTLFALSKLASSYHNRPALIEALLADLKKLFRVKKVLLASFEPLTKRIRIEKTLGYRNSLTPEFSSLMSDTVMSLVYNTGKPAIITPQNWEKKFSTAKYASQDMLLCPIKHQLEITGCLLIAEKDNGHHFSLNNQILLQAISEQIGPVLEELKQEEWERNKQQLKRPYIDPFRS